MRVYTSGPMTGRPGHNEPAFAALAADLRVRGFEVVSPAEETLRLYGSWEEAERQPHGVHLIHDLRILAGEFGPIDGVVVMDDWMESKGSRREVSWAIDYGIPIFDQGMRPIEVAEHFVVNPTGLMATPSDLAPAQGPHVNAAGADYGQVVADPSGAVKADVGKTRLDLLPRAPLEQIAEVLAFGAHKYPDPIARDYNWRRGFGWSRIYAAALRHLFAWWDGEDLDQETGLTHLAHAGCDILFLLEFVHKASGDDDRYLSTMRRAAEAAG